MKCGKLSRDNLSHLFLWIIFFIFKETLILMKCCLKHAAEIETLVNKWSKMIIIKK